MSDATKIPCCDMCLNEIPKGVIAFQIKELSRAGYYHTLCPDCGTGDRTNLRISNLVARCGERRWREGFQSAKDQAEKLGEQVKEARRLSEELEDRVFGPAMMPGVPCGRIEDSIADLNSELARVRIRLSNLEGHVTDLKRAIT